MFERGNKKTGIPPIKISLKIPRQNHHLDSRCKLTIMIPEMMPRAIKNHKKTCCKKIILNK